MAKFSDTPKWKTRAGYVSALKKKTTVKAIKPTAVACPVCGARRGQPCVGRAGGISAQPHGKRHKAAAKAVQARARQAAQRKGQQRARWAGVAVTFVCPACRGGHARADCDVPTPST